jgi:hypothetical protein
MTPNYEKLRDAYAVLDGIPEHKFVTDLSRFIRYPDSDDGMDRSDLANDCQTMACGAGWLYLHGGFGLEGATWSSLVDAFGLSERDGGMLFDSRGYSELDEEIEDAQEGLSDKQLLRARFVLWMQMQGQPVKA